MSPILPLLLLADLRMQNNTHAPVVVPSETTVLDWETLPSIPYRVTPAMTQAMHHWARRQVSSRQCHARRLVDGRPALRVEVAVLVDVDEGVRTTVPRAMGCPAVEQYAAGLVAGFSRNNLTQRSAAGSTWYRATITFAWRS